MRIILLGLIIIASNTFGQVRPADELTKGKRLGGIQYRKEYFSNGNLKVEESFFPYQHTGQFDIACDTGVTKFYFRNGKVKDAAYYSAPCVKDSEIFYWKNGNRQSIVTLEPPYFYLDYSNEYVIFAKNNYEKRFRKNGSLEMEGAYEQRGMLKTNIDREGVWKFYNETGRITKLVTYSKGKKIKEEKMP